MKQRAGRFIELIQSGPPGLFSRADMGRLDEHVRDGAAAQQLIEACGATSLVDVGSGGGIPGVVIALAHPGLHVHLVESLRWKAEFLERCAAELQLRDSVTVWNVRAEEMVERIGRETIDLGTARALASPEVVCEYLSPLVRVGGQILLWSTIRVAEELERSSRAAEAWQVLGLAQPVVHEAPSTLRTHGAILAFAKVAPCAAHVPRRVGVAARRPLQRRK